MLTGKALRRFSELTCYKLKGIRTLGNSLGVQGSERFWVLGSEVQRFRVQRFESSPSASTPHVGLRLWLRPHTQGSAQPLTKAASLIEKETLKKRIMNVESSCGGQVSK